MMSVHDNLVHGANTRNDYIWIGNIKKSNGIIQRTVFHSLRMIYFVALGEKQCVYNACANIAL